MMKCDTIAFLRVSLVTVGLQGDTWLQVNQSRCSGIPCFPAEASLAGVACRGLAEELRVSDLHACR